jgi:hypothetical protein
MIEIKATGTVKEKLDSGAADLEGLVGFQTNTIRVGSLQTAFS